MMMFLSLMCVSFLAMAVLAMIAYETSARDAAPPEVRPDATVKLGTPRFFGGDLIVPPTRAPLPVDAVIAQIERHVRLEQAAAESFLEIPDPGTLHTPTVSRFLN